MRRFVAAFAVMALLAGMAATAAVSQEADPSGLTGLEPLTQIVEGFAAGEQDDALYLEGQTDSGPTGLTQFQFIANLGGGQTFGTRGVEMIPSGLTADGDLVSLEEQFGGTLGDTSQIPAIAPFARGQAMDLGPVFEGWTTYGIGGLVEGPIQILEGVQVVAGIELAEPYDPECTERTHVGRAWVGSTVSASDPLFTAEALTDRYAGTDHNALVGRASRVVELVCFPGSGPQMTSSRMTEESGIRPFGPLEISAMVKGNHVVLIAPIRVLDSDLTQRFYASPPGGGDVVISEVEDEPRLLVPNPYGPNDIRIELEMLEQPADADAASAGGNEGQTRTLLYEEGSGAIVPAQSGGGCTFLDRFFYLLLGQLSFELNIYEELLGSDLLTLGIRAFLAFGPTSSGSGLVGAEAGKLTSTITDATGATQTLTLDGDGTGEVSVSRSGGQPCVAQVRATSMPDIFAGGDSGSDDSDSGSGSDDDGGTGDSTGEEEAGGSGDGEDNGGAGGVPWEPIGIAILLLAAAAGTAYARQRSRTKDCKPEEEAYAAAAAAYETAKKVSDYYIGEFNHYNGEYNDYRNALQNRLDAPDRQRGYPEGPDGDKAYAAAKVDWDAQKAEAQRAEDNVDGARENMEDARRSMDEAIKAQDTAADVLEQAREALSACKGSAPELPGDTETPPTAPGVPTSPGTITDTPDTPDPGCLEGTTKVKIESQRTFEILEGDVKVQLNKTKLNTAYPGGLIDPYVLNALGKSELQDLFSQLEENIAPETMRWVIDTTILTVKCIRIVICQGGSWVETDQTNRVEETAKGPSYQKAIRTQSKALAQELMAQAQSKVTELQANEAAAAAFTCD